MRRRRLAIGIAVAVALALGAREGCRRVQRDLARRALPEVPALDRHNDATRALLLGAAEAARRHPRSPQHVGRLAMVYHAHLHADAARRAYALVSRLDRKDFRWPYLWANLEEMALRWDEAISLYERATGLRPDDADAWARLAALYLSANRIEAARSALSRAREIDPGQPIAALAQARLAGWEGDWKAAIDILLPILARYPRYAEAHALIARAYGSVGREAERAAHEPLGAYGAAVDSPLLEELYEMSVPAILDGDAARGKDLVATKCTRCHTLDRTYRPDQPRIWWGRTVRRMHRLAGASWLTDDEAADIVAHLSKETAAGGRSEPHSGGP
jgi:tetratricopeptide (TPR) repeat protein